MTLSSTLQTVSSQRIALSRSKIETLQGKLDAIDPKVVLKRGFSLTEDATGKLIRSREDVTDGQKIRTLLARGVIESKVECTT